MPLRQRAGMRGPPPEKPYVTHGGLDEVNIFIYEARIKFRVSVAKYMQLST